MTEETEIRSEKGGFMGVVSIILGAGGIFLSYLFIFLYLADILAAETDAAQECRLTAPFFIPAFAAIGILGGMLWLVAGTGYFGKKKWAYSAGLIAVVITLFSSFWPNIPAMESGVVVPGPWFLIFFPNLIVYFILAGKRGSGKKAVFGLVLGMGFILNFINGIAATTRMVNRLPDISLPPPLDYSPAFMYMLTMPTNMIASVLFGITTIGLFLAKKKDSIRIAGLAGVFLAVSSGFPLALYSMFFSGTSFGFSMFIMGPVVSLLAGLIIIPSKVWNKIAG
jgi:hypothetical protein